MFALVEIIKQGRIIFVVAKKWNLRRIESRKVIYRTVIIDVGVHLPSCVCWIPVNILQSHGQFVVSVCVRPMSALQIALTSNQLWPRCPSDIVWTKWMFQSLSDVIWTKAKGYVQHFHISDIVLK